MTSKDVSSPSQPLLDAGRLLTAVRRRSRLWTAMALLGLLTGVGVAVLLPPPPTATMRVLVIHEDDQPSDAGTLVSTDIAILETTRIARAALEDLRSTESPEDFLETYEATPLTNNVFEVSVTGTSDADAVRRAQALGDAFIADHVQRVQAAADAEAQGVLNQRDRAQRELAGVDESITAAEEGDGNPATLETLYARRAELVSRISNLTDQAETAGIGAPRVEAGTQLVDPPRPVEYSMLVAGAANGGIGLALGLAAGLALALVLGVARDRPVWRSDVAEHLGASVVASLPDRPRGPARLWRRTRPVRDRRRVAGTLARLFRGGNEPVSLLELGCARTTAELAVDVATELAADGEVVIVDGLPGDGADVATLLEEAGHERIRVVPAPGDPLPDGRHAGVVGVIGAGSVGPGTAWTDLPVLGRETVLVVRAGHATTDWLHTVARQLADCGVAVLGVVLVDPDPRDHSDGTLWDGLHTALRGRWPSSSDVDDVVPAALPHQHENGRSHTDDMPTKRFAPVRSGDAEGR